MQRYSAPRRATRKGTAADVEEGIGSGGKIVADVAIVDARNNFDRGDSQHLDRLIPCWWDGDNTASTLTKSNANGAQRMPDKDNFGAVLQPVAIPIMPQAMQSKGWRVGKENQDGRGNGLGVGKDGDPCPTLDRSAVPAVAIQGTVIGRQDHNGPQGSGHSDSGEMFTLNSTDVHAVAVAPQEITAFQSSELRLRGTLTNQIVAPTLKSETKSGDTELRVLGTTMQVRRLTPTECERLQGFPDGWTAIPWKKKSADQCPDGPRYKALGNSMAVNCMEWLGERIQAVESGTL